MNHEHIHFSGPKSKASASKQMSLPWRISDICSQSSVFFIMGLAKSSRNVLYAVISCKTAFWLHNGPNLQVLCSEKKLIVCKMETNSYSDILSTIIYELCML